MRHIILVEFVSEHARYISERTDRDISTVEVEADTVNEAHIIAAQMVACRPGIVPTRTWRDPT